MARWTDVSLPHLCAQSPQLQGRMLSQGFGGLPWTLGDGGSRVKPLQCQEGLSPHIPAQCVLGVS